MRNTGADRRYVQSAGVRILRYIANKRHPTFRQRRIRNHVLQCSFKPWAVANILRKYASNSTSANARPNNLRPICHLVKPGSRAILVPQCQSLRLHCSSSRFFPTDCHDSSFERLDLRFQRDSTPFNQCRLQLIIDRRQDTRARRVIRAANRIESSNHHHRPHSVEVPRPNKQ